MSEHINARARCQPDTQTNQANQEQTTPPAATVRPTLVARYGASILTAGHTALPTYAWVYYARLGVSEAEFVYLQQLCTYWWGARDPFPGEAAIAARMGKTVRCIQGYSRSLVGKGLLRVHAQYSAHGRQSTNAYDLRPFFAAIEGLARLDGLLVPPEPTDETPAAAPPRATAPPVPDGGSGEQQRLDAGRPMVPEREGRGEGSRQGGAMDSSPQVYSVEVQNDLDSIPPSPPLTHRAEEIAGADTQGRPQGAEGKATRRPAPECAHPQPAPHVFTGPLGPALCGDGPPPLDPRDQTLPALNLHAISHKPTQQCSSRASRSNSLEAILRLFVTIRCVPVTSAVICAA